MKADPFSFPDQLQSQKCVAGVTPRYELSRMTHKIRNSDKKVKRSKELVNGQEVSLKQTANHGIVYEMYR
jgi:hypothetical protein